MIFPRSAAASQNLTAVETGPETIKLVRLRRRASAPPLLELCECRAVKNDEDPAAALARLAREFRLHRAACATVLDAGEYKMLMTKAPDVPEEERLAALRWQVKDMLDEPLAALTLEAFDAPAERAVYVVAARNKAIEEHVARLRDAKVNLRVIDIPELAQRNIAQRLPEDASGVALLWLHARGGLLTLTRGGLLYLARHLSAGLESLRNTAQQTLLFDQIVLEIQRSLDYFESHFRQAPIRHIVLAPLAEDVPGLFDHLKNNLGAPVRALDLHDIVACDSEPADGWQARHYLGIACALRDEAAP